MPADTTPRSFDDLCVHLRTKNVIHGGKLLIQRLHHLSNAIPKPSAPPAVQVRVNVRVFLTAYMVHYFPGNVLERLDDLAVEMQRASTSILAFVDSAVPALAEGALFREAERDADFLQLLWQHINAFQQWQAPDSQRLEDRLKHALRLLMVAVLALPVTDPETEERAALGWQITRLRQQLLQRAGQEGLDAFDADILANPPVAPPVVQVQTDNGAPEADDGA